MSVWVFLSWALLRPRIPQSLLLPAYPGMRLLPPVSSWRIDERIAASRFAVEILAASGWGLGRLFDSIRSLVIFRFVVFLVARFIGLLVRRLRSRGLFVGRRRHTRVWMRQTRRL